ARHARLAHAARPREEVGVRDAALDDGVAQRPRDRLLTGDVGEGLRAVLPGEDSIGRHARRARSTRLKGELRSAREATPGAASPQAILRHTAAIAYGCSRQGLTRFARRRCRGPTD